MAEIERFDLFSGKGNEETEYRDVIDAMKFCKSSEEVLDGADHLSELIDEYALQRAKELDRIELELVAGGISDPGDRIWKEVLARNNM